MLLFKTIQPCYLAMCACMPLTYLITKRHKFHLSEKIWKNSPSSEIERVFSTGITVFFAMKICLLH